ncbi:POK9 protein, partial [Tricholaema leucomelas]|nr:POK9 protein [Tricholaema leucomelas]
MGALQPGLPSPTVILRHWHVTVIDLKDCFFSIPLHPDDAPKFAFSIPTREAHATFHQNAKGLKRQFQISNDDAKGIIHSCPVCSH